MKIETSRTITEFTMKMNNQLWNRTRTSINPTGKNLLIPIDIEIVWGNPKLSNDK